MNIVFRFPLIIITVISILAKHSLCATSCALPLSCAASNSASTVQSRLGSNSLVSSIDLKFLPSNNLEKCSIKSFCSINPPGSYCYVPSEDVLKNNCSCRRVAYIQCPFGIVNLCNAGFFCSQASNKDGMTTAACQRISTSTTISTTTISTHTHTSTVLHSSKSIYMVTTTYILDRPDRTLTKTATQTRTIVETSTVKEINVSTEISKFQTSLPYYPPSLPNIFVTTIICKGTTQKSRITNTASATHSAFTLSPPLCEGPYLSGINTNQKTFNVIATCVETATVHVKLIRPPFAF